ncbi:MAG: phosphoglucosamine mutase, partial [Bacteroidia bacterium]|nr:phosphoglucosamine mutase [Bacteroidia bacterium]
MTLIKSISGIRGTIGGKPGDGLSPLDIVKFTTAYATWLKENSNSKKLKVLIGRDARISGDMVNRVVAGTLMGMGVDVIDAGLSTTPTVEVGVTELKADGGIILTASHNPKQWNALKLLNSKGEFISEADGQRILTLAEEQNFNYSEVGQVGTYNINVDLLAIHIQQILKLPYVNIKAIKEKNFSIVVDAVNSSGAFA